MYVRTDYFCPFTQRLYFLGDTFLKLKQKNLISVFEGATGRDHHVDFNDYKGECQPRDYKCSLYEAVLNNPSKEAAKDIKDGNNEQIKRKFLEFTKKINEREEDLPITLEVRFGNIYYYIQQDEVTNSAELLNLDVDSVVSKFNSAFQPLHMSHKAVEKFLKEKGYRLTSSETEISLCIQKNGIEKINLNEHLEVVEVILTDKKRLKFNVKRMDSKKRDYRFNLFETKIMTSVPQKYKGKMVRREGDEDLLCVTEEFINEVKMIREKTTQKYSKDGTEGEVRLEKVREYFKPKGYVRFNRVKPWREEVVIKYKVPETGTDSDYTRFIQKVMKLSYKLEEGQLESDSGTDEDEDEFFLIGLNSLGAGGNIIEKGTNFQFTMENGTNVKLPIVKMEKFKVKLIGVEQSLKHFSIHKIYFSLICGQSWPIH